MRWPSNLPWWNLVCHHLQILYFSSTPAATSITAITGVASVTVTHWGSIALWAATAVYTTSCWGSFWDSSLSLPYSWTCLCSTPWSERRACTQSGTSTSSACRWRIWLLAPQSCLWTWCIYWRMNGGWVGLSASFGSLWTTWRAQPRFSACSSCVWTGTARSDSRLSTLSIEHEEKPVWWFLGPGCCPLCG